MKTVLICILVLVIVSFAPAQQPTPAPTHKSMSSYLGLHTFPAKNQAAEQQQKDEMACYDWAKQDSGFDPLAAAQAQQQAATPPPAQPTAPQTRGAGAKGAAGGAAKGAVLTAEYLIQTGAIK